MCMEAWSSQGCAWRLGVVMDGHGGFWYYCRQVMHGKEQRKPNKQTLILGEEFHVCILHLYMFFLALQVY